MSIQAKDLIDEGYLKDSRGFTLTELLVTCVFSLTVLGTLYGFYRTQVHNLKFQEKRTEILEAARATLDLMVREIRDAGYWPSSGGTAPPGCARIQVATPTQIQIQTDLNGDGDCSDTHEDITYSYNSTSKTIERISSSSPVASGVEIPTGSSFLTYYAGSTTALTHPISDLSTIKRVKITFEVKADDPTPEGKALGRTLKTTMVSNVYFRNN